MRESALWATMKKALSKVENLDMSRIENSAGLGTPDVELCCKGRQAWVELKLVKEWPKRDSTVVRIDHFTDVQRLWLKKRGTCGGRAFLLVQVVDVGYFLFNHAAAQGIGRDVTRAAWFDECVYHSDKCDWVLLLRTMLTS